MEIIEVISKLKTYAENNFVPIIRPKSAEILVNFIQNIKPKNILEVGTAIGYSGILMLRSADSDTTLTTIEKDETRLKIAEQAFNNCGFSSRVTTILGDANEEVKKLNTMYDFIFLDGPKTHYLKQLPYLLKHINRDGVLIADNVLFMGQVLSGEYPKHKHRTAILSLRKFLETIKNCPNLESEILDIEDGLVIAKKIK